MLNLKKTEILLGILLLIFISGIFIFRSPDIISNFFLIDSKATQDIALSITIIGSQEEEVTIPESGEIKPTDSVIKQTIPKIAGFSNHEGDKVKIRIYTSALPEGFTAPPSTSVETVFNYINISLDTTLTNTAVIYFNVSSSDLNSIDPNNIRLFKHSSIWTELSTTVEDSTNDPVSFSAETTSFSRFLIGESVGGLPGVTTPSTGGGISHGGISIPKAEEPIPKLIIPIIPEKVAKIVTERIEKVAEAVVEKPTKVEIWLYAIFPLIIIALTILLSVYYLIKQVIHRKLTAYALLLLLYIIGASVMVTSEVFYWAILPLSIIIILIFLFYTLILEKTFRILMKINVKKIIKMFSIKTKAYVILLFLAFIVGLLVIVRSGYITGHTIVASSVNNSFGGIVIAILIILGMGIYYIKKIRN